MYNILYYTPNLTKKGGGIYQYSYGLLKNLADSGNQFYIFNQTPDKDLLELIESFPNFILVENEKEESKFQIKIKNLLAKIIDKILNVLGSTYRMKYFKINKHLDFILDKYKIDLIHCPFQQTAFPSKKTPTITTIHDVQELHFPQFFNSDERLYRAKLYKLTIDHSDVVVVSYNHIKSDIHNFFSKPLNDIHVCLMDMKNLWFEKLNGVSSIEKLESLNIPDDFILYPAATWEHKNHLQLIESISILNEKYNIKVNLICTGSMTNNIEKIKTRIKELKIEDQIFFLGIVSEEILFSLYKKTRATVVPTLYEAGSFPLIESVLMGIPVVCSNTTSLPETMGDMSFVFDPLDPNDISEKIYNIVTNEDYRALNIENSKKQSKHLINTGINDKINSIYSHLVN